MTNRVVDYQIAHFWMLGGGELTVICNLTFLLQRLHNLLQFEKIFRFLYSEQGITMTCFLTPKAL